MKKIVKFGIDIGSSTLKMVSLYEDNSLKSCDFLTALAAEFTEDKIISDKGIKRLTDALDQAFKIINQHPQALIKVVATEAFRQAKNSQHICELLKQRYEICCQILSQEEEADLTFKGASAYAKIPIKWLIDIGGASTEINTGEKKYLFQDGLLSLINKYGNDLNTLQQAACEIFKLNIGHAELAHCSSKSLIYALSAQAKISNYEINEYDYAGEIVDKKQILALAKLIQTTSKAELFRLFDANSAKQKIGEIERAKAINCACAILLALPFEAYIISPHALKEGLLV